MPLSDMKNKTQALLLEPLFAACSQQSLAALLPQLTERRCQTGEAIFSTTDKATHFYLLLQGSVRLVSPLGREFGLQHQHLGEEVVHGARHYLTNARALGEVLLVQIPKAAMLALADANPTLKDELLLSLTSHLAGEKLARPTPVAAQANSAAAVTKKTAIKPARIVGWLLALLLPLLLLAYGEQWGMDRTTTIFAAIFTAAVMMWSFTLVDEYIPALFAVLGVLLTGLVPTPVIMSGFASDGFLMALSTLALGAVVVSSGLSYRFMLILLRRLPNTQFWQAVGLFSVGAMITPIIPTLNGRMSLVSPFYADMADSLRLTPRGAAATRLAMACFNGATLLSAMLLTSKSINYAVAGLMPRQDQEYFQLLTWLTSSGVVLLVLLLLYAAASTIWFRNQEIPQLPKERVEQQLLLLGKLKKREWAALLSLLFIVGGVATSAIHDVSPPWLGFTALCVLVLCGFLKRQEFRDKVDWTFLLYMSGVTGLAATIGYLRLDTVFVAALPALGQYMHDHFMWFVLWLFCLMCVVRLAVPNNATVIVAAAVLMPLAESAGINSWVIGFIILLFSEVWFLPFQSSYYMQLHDLNKSKSLYDEKSFLYFNAFMNVARLLAVYASIPFWKMMGFL